MNRRFPVVVLLFHFLNYAAGPGPPHSVQVLAVKTVVNPSVEKLMAAALADSSAYERLAYLTDTFGPRFSGTRNLEDAIDWILSEMTEDGLQNVHGEGVRVPRWVRGTEKVELLEPRYKNLAMLGLGGSVGTPPEGITAEVLVVKNFDELAARADEAEGKIVLFNAPFTTYGETVEYRIGGASAAARAGAVASLVRSVGPYSMNTPHTGGMGYEEGVRKVPHGAITVEDAMMIQRMVNGGKKVVVRMYMEAHFEEDVLSRNVVGEIVGREKPEEVVVLGGHIDSWDVGTGAMDDAGGCVAAWEAVRLMHALNVRPRRTVRVVLWTNEENGLRGAKAYRDAHQDELGNHILAMESDNGVFKPMGFGFTGSDRARGMVEEIVKYLKPIEADSILEGGSAADIGPLEKEGVPVMSLKVDRSRYFWYHHTHADTIDKLDPHELNLCIAALAVMAYGVADLPERLPR
ncbi:MAG: M28 family metallopeptidase [Fidelibacterota bacterium]